MNRVKFTLPDVGLREISGMVSLEDGFVVLKLKSAIVGLLDEKNQTVKIEPSALLELRIKRGLIHDILILRPKKIDLLDVVPGDHPTYIKLKVKRKYREELDLLVRAFYNL